MTFRIHALYTVFLLCVGMRMTPLTDAAKICRSTSIPFHTWVQMDYSCAQAGNCGIRQPFTGWRDIGYENGGGGVLRDESKNPGGVYRCSSWFVGELQGGVAQAATAQQERSAIAALVDAGWNTARYGLIAGGLTSIVCDPTSWSWAPRDGRNNVCWTFTCAYSAYLYRSLGVRPRGGGGGGGGGGGSFIATGTGTGAGALEIPSAWTCKPEQYGTGDGCQCNCGAFDPDCNPFEAVTRDCPNHDDICIPGSQNEPICALRHQVLSDRKLLQIQAGVAVHHPQFYFSNDTDVDGAPWGNYSKTYTRSDIPAAWTCNPLFYGSKDGCDCECGAWDPDCDAGAAGDQRVFNCDTSNTQVQCVMSKTTATATAGVATAMPVCLYDRMAAAAAVDAGYPSPGSSGAPSSVPTTTIIAASVGSTLGVVVIISVITYFIIHKKRVMRRRALLQPL